MLGRDRVMSATDYPFEEQREAAGFVEPMPLAPSDKKALFQDVATRALWL